MPSSKPILKTGPPFLSLKGLDALSDRLSGCLDSFRLEPKHRMEPERAKEFLSGERGVIFFLLLTALILHIVYAFRYTIDSDEPQHLKVVWGWAEGLLQYRDFFDNHTPLFHMLFSPLFSAFGERADILLFMRLAMAPLYAASLWATYFIGSKIYSKRESAWAAVLAGLFPAFFLPSVEFRTDDLWTLFWLFSLAILVSGKLSIKRSLSAGIFLGAAAAVSLKTTLLLAALAAASLAVFGIRIKRHFQGKSFLPDRYVLCPPAFLIGSILIPVLLALFFVSKGAFSSFLYGTVKHNIVPGLGGEESSLFYRLLFSVCCIGLWLGARLYLKSSLHEGRALRRVFIFLISGIYLAALVCFWPLVPPQDFLPVCPLAFILLAPLVLAYYPSCPSANGRFRTFFFLRSIPAPPLPFLVALFEIALLIAVGAPWQDGTKRETALIKDALALTEPSDYVLDLKGEMIFRRRSFYYALETITQERIRRGLITDDIPERMIASRTLVAALDDESFPRRARKFLKANYLPVGTLRVAGQLLPELGGEAASSISFDVVIPARYAIIAEAGEVRGVLDGASYDGPRVLESGRHEFIPLLPKKGLALLWAKAVEKGFSPFRMENKVR